MRLRNVWKLSCGGKQAYMGNAIDAPAALTAAFEGKDILARIAVGGDKSGGGTEISAPLAVKQAERVAWNYDPSRGALFARAKARFTDADIPPGTFVAEAGFHADGAGKCYTRAVSSAFLQKPAGEDLVAEGTVYLEVAGERTELAAGENAFAAFLLGANPAFLSGAFTVRLLDALCPGAREYPAGKDFPARLSGKALIADVPPGTPAGGAVFCRDGVPFLAVAPASPVTAALAVTGSAELTAYTAEFVSASRGGEALKRYQYDLMPYKAEAAPCAPPPLSEQAEFVTAAAELQLYREGAAWSLWRTRKGCPAEELPAPDLPGGAAGCALSDEGTAFLLLPRAPYLAAYAREGNAFVQRSLPDAPLFRGGTELYHPRGFHRLIVKALDAGVWHVREYLYTDVLGEIRLTLLQDEEFLEPALFVDPFSGARLYVDRASRTVKHRDTAGLTYKVAEAMEELILTRNDIIADLKYLYVFQPTLAVYELSTGARVTAEGEGLCKTLVSPRLDCIVRLFADNTFETACIDTAAGRLRATARGRTAGKVRGVRFLGDDLLFYENGSPPECFRLYGGGFSLRVRDGGTADVTYTQRRFDAGGLTVEVGV